MRNKVQYYIVDKDKLEDYAGIADTAGIFNKRCRAIAKMLGKEKIDAIRSCNNMP